MSIASIWFASSPPGRSAPRPANPSSSDGKGGLTAPLSQPGPGYSSETRSLATAMRAGLPLFAVIVANSYH